MSEKRWALKADYVAKPSGGHMYPSGAFEQVEVPCADEAIVPHEELRDWLSCVEANKPRPGSCADGAAIDMRSYLPKPRPTLREAFLDHGWVGGEQFSAVCREAGIDPDERRPA